MGEVSEHFDREDAKKEAPKAWAIRGPAWLLAALALGGFVLKITINLPLLRGVPEGVFVLSFWAFAAIAITAHFLVRSKVDGDTNGPEA